MLCLQFVPNSIHHCNPYSGTSFEHSLHTSHDGTYLLCPLLFVQNVLSASIMLSTDLRNGGEEGYGSIEGAHEEHIPGELSRHARAAWLIEETLRGQKASSDSLPRTTRARNVYLFYRNFAPLRQCAVLALIFLSFFERPSWCTRSACAAPDASDAFLSGVPYLTPSVALLINISALAVLVAFALVDASTKRISFHSYVLVQRVLLIALCVELLYSAYWQGHPPIRFAPMLRTFLPLFYWQSLMQVAFAIGAVIRPFFDVFVIVVVFVLFFGWFCTLLYHDIPQANRYFGSLPRGLYTAFTCTTTADWPMQVMALIDVTRPAALLFLVFIVICVFILFNVRSHVPSFRYQILQIQLSTRFGLMQTCKESDKAHILGLSLSIR